jgi:hypothetical protein
MGKPTATPYAVTIKVVANCTSTALRGKRSLTRRERATSGNHKIST